MSEQAVERDVRRGGRWSPAQRLKNELVFRAVRGGLGVADRLQPGQVERALALLVTVAPKRDLVARLSPALGTAVAADLARRWYAALARNLAATLALRDTSRSALSSVALDEGARSSLDELRAPARGAIVVGAHVGPFELIPAVFAERGLAPVVVVRESYDPRLDPLVDRHRVARGVALLHRGRAGAPRGIVRALRARAPVGFLVDLARSVPSVPVTLARLGTRVAVGPLRLALRLDVPVFFVGLRRVEAAPAPPPAPGTRWRMELRRLPFRTESSGLALLEAALSDLIAADPAEWLGLADVDPLPAIAPAP